MKRHLFFSCLLLLIYGIDSDVYSKNEIPDSLIPILPLLGIDTSGCTYDSETEINDRGVKTISGNLTYLNQECYLSYDEDMRHFFIDAPSLLESRQDLPKNRIEIELLQKKIDEMIPVIMKGQSEKLAAPIIEESTYYVKRGLVDFEAIPYWRVLVPRMIEDKFTYAWDGIFMLLTGEGVPFSVNFKVTSNRPPNLNVSIDREQAIQIATPLLPQAFKTVREDVFSKIHTIPEFYIDSAKLVINNTNITFHPLNMNFISRNRFDTRLVWYITFKNKKHIYFPDDNQRILLQKGYEFDFELDPVTGEWIGWDFTL